MICFGCWPLVTKRTCIKGGFHDVHALVHIVVHSVHIRCLIKCLLGILSLVWISMSTKLWGFSCFLIRNMFGLLIVYLTNIAPHVHFPCIGHALHIATSCTHLCYPCHALLYSLFLHPTMSWFTLYFVTFCFVFCLSFISHSSCTLHASFSLFIPSSLAFVSPWPFVYSCQKGWEYTLE